MCQLVFRFSREIFRRMRFPASPFYPARKDPDRGDYAGSNPSSFKHGKSCLNTLGNANNASHPLPYLTLTG